MTPREELARLAHEVLVGGDADELIHHPAAKSWEEPTMPRWEQWGELADAILSRFPVSAPDGGEVEELVARLERTASGYDGSITDPLGGDLLRQAASLIRSQAGLLAEALEIIRPFAAFGDVVQRYDTFRERPWPPKGDDRVPTADDWMRAASYLSKLKGQEKPGDVGSPWESVR